MLKRLPDLFYNFSSRPLDSDYLLVKNIWRRAQILVEYKTQVTLFTEENVRDGERPEDIATRLYQNPFCRKCCTPKPLPINMGEDAAKFYPMGGMDATDVGSQTMMVGDWV